MKQLFFIVFLTLSILSCDNKKTSIAGTVVNKATGQGVYNMLISYVHCKEDGDNCTEVIIGQTYTLQDGSFKIDQRRASKSKKRWVTVHSGTKKVGQLDNVGINDKSIKIEVTP